MRDMKQYQNTFPLYEMVYFLSIARNYCLLDIHQLNLIMEILGTPKDEFMAKISSESVSFHSFFLF